jgi:hypothetical protein
LCPFVVQADQAGAQVMHPDADVDAHLELVAEPRRHAALTALKPTRADPTRRSGGVTVVTVIDSLDGDVSASSTSPTTTSFSLMTNCRPIFSSFRK